MNSNTDSQFIQYEIVIQPAFHVGKGRDIDEFKEATLTLYARDIQEAIEKAKALLNVRKDCEIEVVSACTIGIALNRR